jgi:hypothetical protein
MTQTAGISLGQITQWIGIAVAASFVASFFYDWGFLSSLGLLFTEIPTSPADSVQSALNWLPWVTIAVGGNVIWYIIGEFADEGLTPREVLKSTYAAQRWQYRFRLGMAWVVLAFLAFAFVFFGEIASIAGAMVASVAWFAFALEGFRTQRLVEKYPHWLQLTFAAVPAAALLLFGYGWSVGIGLSRQGYVSSIEYVGGRAGTAIVLRAYERGLLLQEDRRISFRSWDEVASVRYQVRRPMWLGLACSMFDNCAGDRTPNIGDPPTHSRS